MQHPWIVSCCRRINQKLFSLYRKVFFILEFLFKPNSYSVYPSATFKHHHLSFSQEGEDVILERIFENRSNGYYVDVGAHHPQRFSNTYLFYLKGWRGINIDAMPESMIAFNKLRPEDINVEVAIANVSEPLTYHMFNEPALNSFSYQISTQRDELPNYKITDKRKINTKALSEILDEYLPEGQDVDFLSIDVEGLDHQVLLSNDWSKYKFKIILIEELSIPFDEIPQKSKIYCLLKQQGYELFARTFNTSFYKLSTFE